MLPADNGQVGRNTPAAAFSARDIAAARTRPAPPPELRRGTGPGQRGARKADSLCRHIRFRPIAEVAETGAAGAGGENGGAEVEESAEDVVVHAADFSRFAGLLPALAGESEVEIDFLVVIGDAQSGAGCALLLAAGDVAVGYAHADALAVQQDAGRVLGIVEKQQAGGAAGGDLDVNFDGIGVAADRGGESGTVGQRTAARLQVQHALAGRKARLVELVPEGPLQAEFGAGEAVRGVGEG